MICPSPVAEGYSVFYISLTLDAFIFKMYVSVIYLPSNPKKKEKIYSGKIFFQNFHIN